jgi:lysophospholipase
MRPPVFDRRAIPREAAETTWKLPDGHALRRIDWALPRGTAHGSLLFMPGRADAYEKYLESLNHWYRCGWGITAADWRGQAGSGRLGADAVTGHVEDFAVWIDDLAALWNAWKAGTPGPHVLVAHSMGGHIALRALAEKRIDPDALVLSAPMLGIIGLKLPLPLLHGVAKLMTRIGDKRRPAWKWSERPGEVPEERINLLTHDANRYADELWWRGQRKELNMGAASWGWVERAYDSVRRLERPGALEAIQTPVLMLATTADRLVDFAAIARAVRRLPKGELLRFGAEASHEILREIDPVRDKALAAVDAFFDSALSTAG